MRHITPDLSAHTVKAEMVLRQARLQIAYKPAEGLFGDVLAVEMLHIQTDATHTNLTQLHQFLRCFCKPLLCVCLRASAQEAIQLRPKKSVSTSKRSKRLV